MLSRKNQEDGFTLIELLVVIIIIGILAAIAIPLFLDQRKLAVDASVKADVRNTLTNIQTWQAKDEANRTKAIANTGEFTNATNGGKVAQSPGNSLGISIDSTGAATVCAYDAGGKTYTADSAAYVFNPANGQFTTGSCAAGSTTGGTAAGGSSSGGSSALVGGVSNGNYTATLETGDSTNSMWGGANMTGVGSTSAQAHGGTKSFGGTYYPSSGAINSSGGADAQRLIFTPSPTLVTGKTYTVSAWVYLATTSPNERVTVEFLRRSQADSNTVGIAPSGSAQNKWQQVTFTTDSVLGSGAFLRIYPQTTVANGSTESSATLYVDDLTITAN